MTDRTDSDVELVAEANLASDYPTPGAWDQAVEWEREDYRVAARAILSALAAAGRLLPTGGETGAEYNLRFRDGGGRWITDDDLTSYKPEDDWSHTRRLFGAGVHQVTRTVTTWPDGTALVGPWQPTEEGT